MTLESDTSFLRFQDFPDKLLLEECVVDVRDMLDEYPPIIIFGKICHQRRCVGFFSNHSRGYFYSNQLTQSKRMTPSLQMLLAYVNTLYHTNYNGILVNKYKTGVDYISAHSDDETNLDGTGVVAISWGATRKFRIRDKLTKKIITDFPMISGSMLQMGGQFQKDYTHEVPIEKKVKEERISFTFRKHNE